MSGFTTIHLDDVRKLPDRIQNMMSDARDAERMENRIYRYVNVGILDPLRQTAGPERSEDIWISCVFTAGSSMRIVFI